MAELTFNERHSIFMDSYGEYFNGSYQDQQVVLYVLNEHGEKYLPRVQRDVWNNSNTPNILAPIAIKQTRRSRVVVFPPFSYTLEEYLRRVRCKESVHVAFDRDQVALKIAKAMIQFVNCGLLHCQLSSQNIFVTPDGEFVIAGLFSSCAMEVFACKFYEFWTAPEILSGSGRFDYSCDVYSYGIILTELDTLQVPYFDQPLDNLRTRIVNDDLRPNYSDNCPEWYADLVDSCVASRAAERPTFEDIVATIQSHN